MSDELAERIARRRRAIRLKERRRRQVRRRRLVLGSVLLLLFAGVGFITLRHGGNRTGGSTLASAGNDITSTTLKVSGAQPDDSWTPHEGPVPILMYHVIGDPAAGAANSSLYLSVADFQDQVDWLEDNGYTAVTLNQVQDAWYDGATLPENPVVLSFDDGYLGQYLEAMPILRKKGWGGLLNLKAEGSDLNTTEVKKMMKAGWEIASHTITHLDLTSLDPAMLEDEVAGSKRQLETELGVDIDNFCYPAGKYDDSVIAAVEDAGYRGATTTNPGLARKDMPFELDRIRISQGEGSEALASYMSAY